MLNEARIEVAPASASSRAPRLDVPALRRIRGRPGRVTLHVAMARGDEVGKIGFHMSTLHDPLGHPAVTGHNKHTTPRPCTRDVETLDGRCLRRGTPFVYLLGARAGLAHARSCSWTVGLGHGRHPEQLRAQRQLARLDVIAYLHFVKFEVGGSARRYDSASMTRRARRARRACADARRPAARTNRGVAREPARDSAARRAIP